VKSHPALDAVARAGIRLGLDRVGAFLRFVGDPQLAAPAVHVAGTNGKGSVCTVVTSALVEAGFRVGTTISPHVEELNERVQIDGVPVSDEVLDDALCRMDDARRKWARHAGIEGEVLTYFELATAAAFVVFADHAVDVMVVEVGLGGRLDATNVVRPLVCAIPTIGLDHQAELGPDLASIAREKAGIVKPGVPVVIGPLPPEARAVFDRVCAEVGAPLWAPPALSRERHRDGRLTFRTPRGEIGPVHLGMEGEHQEANAMVAVAAVHCLSERGFAVSDAALLEALATARIPVRLEWIAPGVVADGAHNPDGTRALAAWLASRPRPRRRVLVFGMGEDRDPREVLAPLVPHVDAIVTARCAHPRARDPRALARMVRDLAPDVTAGGAIEDTLPLVVANADETIVAGSLFLAGAARSVARAGRLVWPAA